MSANNHQFIQTRNMFREYLAGYPKNPNFEEWLNADDEDKAALLYVKFYQEVTLAWYNAVVSSNIVYVTQEDGISTVLQYLMKNVSKIVENPERYSEKYIYRVCFNCLLGLWKTRSTDAYRSLVELPTEFSTGCPADLSTDKSVILWDLVPSEDEDLETQQTKEAIWNIIRHMGPKAEKVVNHLINPKDTLHRVSGSSSERSTDRLADVSVSKTEFEEILEELKVKLAPYKDILSVL